jgi:protein TonB
MAALLGMSAATPAIAADEGWAKKVAQLVSANYSYPRSAQLRGDEGSARVSITVAGNGKVVSVDLIKSTGSPILDREAVRIPMKVGTYPAPPGGANTKITVPITWRMD